MPWRCSVTCSVTRGRIQRVPTFAARRPGGDANLVGLLLVEEGSATAAAGPDHEGDRRYNRRWTRHKASREGNDAETAQDDDAARCLGGSGGRRVRDDVL